MEDRDEGRDDGPQKPESLGLSTLQVPGSVLRSNVQEGIVVLDTGPFLD